MPSCSQGDIFELAPKFDLTVVFGHISFNDLGGTWLEFKRNHPKWLYIHDPFSAFGNQPQIFSDNHWIWFVPDDCNAGMSNDQVVEVFDAVFKWAAEMKLRRIITNGIRNIGHDPDYRQAAANRASDNSRALFLFNLLRSHEAGKAFKITLTSLTDVFIRNKHLMRPKKSEIQIANKQGNQMSSNLPPLSKNDFLNAKHAKGFIEFLEGFVSGKKFGHEYRVRRSKKTWICSSVYDAFESYSYPIAKQFRDAAGSNHESFAANALVLKSLQSDLRTSKTAADLLAASIKVLEWGGVAGTNNEKSLKAGNRLWLQNKHPHGEGLAKNYEEAKDIFLAESPNLDAIGRNGTRSNAGFTKIYSLLFENFIIYDSRVAAALGLFIVRYCRENRLEAIPPELDFGWMPAKEAANTDSPKLRNAEAGALKFSRASSERIHASANIRANWIFEMVLTGNKQPSSEGFAKLPEGERLRALESAFFMIGYDLGSHPWLSDSPISLGSDQPDREIELHTIAEGKPFKVQDLGVGYRLIVGQSTSKLFLQKAFIDEIVEEFAGMNLAIGASRTNPTEGSLGAMLMDKVSPTAMASYVAPLLVHLELAVKKDRYTIEVLDVA